MTVFTPTYNRAHTLPRLFQSLLEQTQKGFAWLVIDDGSTDNTQNLIANFAKDAPFEIRYIFQPNQGKHIAINRAAAEVETDFLMTVDSDDFLSDHAVEQGLVLADSIKANEQLAGFTFIRAAENQEYDQEDYGKRTWFAAEPYKWKITGEMMFVLKTSVARRFPFPVYAEERFCQESVMLNQILGQYEILFTDHILAFGDYLEDGLSQNLYQRLLDNPRYAMLAMKSKLKMAKTYAAKMELTSIYWDIALKSQQPKLLTLFRYPLQLTLTYFVKRLKKS